MRVFILFIFVLLISCSKENNNIDNNPDEDNIIVSEFISATDISSWPQIESKNLVFYNLEGQEEDVLTTFINSGINTIRLRIWYNPVNEHSGFEEVKLFSERLQSLGLKVWISVHYSNTWADPGNQKPPLTWQDIPYNAILDSVYFYTERIINEIHPDYIQIGNEINSGLLFPYGDFSKNESNFLEILSEGIKAVRDNSENIKIIMHYGGINGCNWFFNKLINIDYDIIGISYYPVWHGKGIGSLSALINNLGNTFNKEIIIAETAYPFTLDWNDWTHNIVGLTEQLILPDYPASPKGQQDFISKIVDILYTSNYGIGFCYWGGEMVAFNGPKATNGSHWENQALYDFNNKALPVLNEFKRDF